MLFAAAALWGAVFPVAAQISVPAPAGPQDRPVLDPITCPLCPGEGIVPPTPRPDIGIWPVEQAYFVSVDWFGRERTDKWVQKGLDSLRKNIYRKYYIEKGYFLIMLPSDSSRDREMDHFFYISEDPKSEPQIIFMKDIHRLEESGRGLSQSIITAMLEGDTDLIRLAGRTLFDSKFTAKEWSYDLHQMHFGSTGPGESSRPYYYKFRQNGLTKIKVEGGVGGSLQLGNAPYYVGGSLGMEASAKFKYRQSELAKDAVPRAKIGFWGKVPFIPNASFGLNALQGWHAEGGIFETEIRAGLFHGMGNATLGAVAYRRITGEELLSSAQRAVGGKIFYSPSAAVSLFLSYERSRGSSQEKDEQVFLFGVDLAGRNTRAADPALWARTILGEKETAAGRAAFFSLCQDGAGLLAKKPARAQELLDGLRLSELSRLSDFTLALPGGLFLRLSPQELMEAAGSMERWTFLNAPRGVDARIPGWPGMEAAPRKGSEVVSRLLERIPRKDLRAALEFADPALSAQVAPIILIHAAAARRTVDFRVTQALMFLALTVEKAADPFARLTGDDPEAEQVWFRITRESRSQLLTSKEPLRQAGGWLKREFEEDGEKLSLYLAGYGRERLRLAQAGPAWPKNLTLSVADEDWAPLLAGYGEGYFAAIVDPFRQHAAKHGSSVTQITLTYWPLPSSSIHLRKIGSDYYVALPPPDHRRSPQETLHNALELIHSALKN